MTSPSLNVGPGGGSLERSYSLPPIRRKERRVANNLGINVTTPTTTSSNHNHSSSSDMPSLRNKLWNKSVKAMVGQKANIRVSKFDPLRVDLSPEVLEQMQQATSNKCSCHLQQHHHNTSFNNSRQEQAGASSAGIIKRIHSSMKKRSDSSSSSASSNNEYVMKTAQLRLVAGESLGISIRKRKLSKKHSANYRDVVFVSKIRPLSTADKCSDIRVGDQVVMVNGVDVGGLCVKKVAAMMVIMKDNLLLTLRSSTSSSSSSSPLPRNNISADPHHTCTCSNHRPPAATAAPAIMHMATLHEDDVIETPVELSASATSTFTASVYDNNNSSIFNPNPPQPASPLELNNPIQQKFDESLQLLQDAIKGCEKSVPSAAFKQHKVQPLSTLEETDLSEQGGDFDFTCLDDILRNVRPTTTTTEEVENDYDDVAGSVGGGDNSSMDDEIDIDELDCKVAVVDEQECKARNGVSRSKSLAIRGAHGSLNNGADLPSFTILKQQQRATPSFPVEVVDGGNKELLKSQLTLPLSSSSSASVASTTTTNGQLKRNSSTNGSVKSNKSSRMQSGDKIKGSKTAPNLVARGAKTPKGDKSASLLATSPTRSSSRKKNWGQKLSRKFRFGGGGTSHGDMNEAACSNNKDWLPNIERKAMGKCDSNVLHRYHLDISMAHQRRISRQLLLGNPPHAPHPPHTSDPKLQLITPSQFKKYKPHNNNHHHQSPTYYGSNGNTPTTPTYFPHHHHQHQPQLIDGCLVITIYGVSDLKKTQCEANCLLQIDDVVDKRVGTTMETCRGQVTWNQCFEMTVSKAKMLQLQIYTWDTRSGKHKKSSQASVNLCDILHGVTCRDMFYRRLAVRLEPRGIIYIKIALEPSSTDTGPLMFGADLQSIVEREHENLRDDERENDDDDARKNYVPRLVRQCIDEVEKRGMQVVGIYRLCGSAIVKRELRQKLEESKVETSLTADHYPDVNVITGILKDFLRELPQPLFPPELLEAVTSLMETRPGPLPTPVTNEPPTAMKSVGRDTDEGEGEEEDEEAVVRRELLLRHIHNLAMMSHAEKSTLYALMNHLKKVAMHNRHNKMNCQNLAVCFGPVLLGPTNTTGGMDLKGAIGFKRHIQVLNYMLSNWPSTPVAYTHLVTADTIASPPSHDADDYDEVSEAVPTALPNHLRNSASSSSLKRVSLTRRVSRMMVEEGGGEDGDAEWKEQEVTLVVTNQDLVTSSTILTSLDSIAESGAFVEPYVEASCYHDDDHRQLGEES